MALSYVSYVAPGAVTDFTITFDYIAEAYVKVYLDGVLQVVTTDYTFFNATTIRFNVAPSASEVVRLERETLNTARLVDFQDQGNLTEADLDLSANQAFHMAQEGIDDFNDLSLKLTGVLTWDAQSHRIVNVSDPVNPQDAATKEYVDSENDAQMVDLNAAVAATVANAAATAADVVTTNADVVSTNADAVSTAADVVTVAGIYDSFDDRYLGAKASDPTLDNDGDALVTGALYFNTTAGNMRVYGGVSWAVIDNASPATTTSQGTVEIATQAEVDAGVDTTRSITPATLAAAAGLGAGGLVDTQIFTASGTWTAPADYSFIEVTVVGGGGGGAGTTAATAGQFRVGGSGGGGGFVKGRCEAADLSATETVTVGAGGAASGAGGAGNDGGGSQFSSGVTNLQTFAATGGTAGATDSFARAPGNGGSATFGGSVTNVMRINGQHGIWGSGSSGGASGHAWSGPGGDAGGGFGPGAEGPTASTVTKANGIDAAQGYGGGGSGGIDNGNASGTTAGGAGRSGIVIVKAYA